MITKGGFSSGQDVSISADGRRGGGGAAAAAVSGLDRVELWQGDAVTGQLLGANDTDYPTNHDYTLADLGIFSALPEGRITVKVLDQAANESIVSFVVNNTHPTWPGSSWVVSLHLLRLHGDKR